MFRKLVRFSVVAVAFILSGCTVVSPATQRPVNNNLTYINIEGFKFYYPKDYKEYSNPQFEKAYKSSATNELGGGNNIGFSTQKTSDVPTSAPTQSYCQELADSIVKSFESVAPGITAAKPSIVNESEGYYGCTFVFTGKIQTLQFTTKEVMLAKKGVTDKLFAISIFYDSKTGAAEQKNLEDALLLSR